MTDDPRTLSDADLLRLWQASDGESAEALVLLDEIQRRELDA